MKEYWSEYKQLIESFIPNRFLKYYNSKYFELGLLAAFAWGVVGWIVLFTFIR